MSQTPNEQRLTDLVRYMRGELYVAKLIDDKELAALVSDSEGGKRVARLEGYDAMRRRAETAESELSTLRAQLAQRAEGFEKVATVKHSAEGSKLLICKIGVHTFSGHDCMQMACAYADEINSAWLASSPAQPWTFLMADFLEAVNDIGAYGFQKYGSQSFQARRDKGDTSRGELERTKVEEIASHAHGHFQMYMGHTLHDHFGTLKHQLAAVAFNAMMEFYFAGLSDELPTPLVEQKDGKNG